MGKIVILVVVTMVLPQEQSCFRLVKCEFTFRLKPFSERHLQSGLGHGLCRHGCTRFPFVGNGERGFSLAMTMRLRSCKAGALVVESKAPSLGGHRGAAEVGLQ